MAGKPRHTACRHPERCHTGSFHVVAGILWRQGRYLAVRRPKGFRHAGMWEFPGGKVEPWESRRSALARELVEELDVRPTACELWRTKSHAYPTYEVILHFFHVPGFEGEPVPLEGQGLSWVNPPWWRGYAFLPADVDIARDLSRFDLSTMNCQP